MKKWNFNYFFRYQCWISWWKVYHYLCCHILSLLLQDESWICTRKKNRKGVFSVNSCIAIKLFIRHTEEIYLLGTYKNVYLEKNNNLVQIICKLHIIWSLFIGNWVTKWLLLLTSNDKAFIRLKWDHTPVSISSVKVVYF